MQTEELYDNEDLSPSFNDLSNEINENDGQPATQEYLDDYMEDQVSSSGQKRKLNENILSGIPRRNEVKLYPMKQSRRLLNFDEKFFMPPE